MPTTRLAITAAEADLMGYTDLPIDAKAAHDEIALILGLTLEKTTEYDVLLALARRIVALEAK